ncbi:uncharacterized protein TNCV_1566591 [Trichonephila clavipes]|nr:uncharacterized protein TNCV_1566591 [Trichonephila clavipes]
MDLPSPVSPKSYERIMRKINLASREVADDSMKNAAKEEVSASGSNEICVSGDGTWKTRGHTSRIGVCSVIGDVTGKVIDVAVLSSYCKGCEKWSTDEEPMHHFCPIGDTSWCKYQKAVATNSASLFKHKNICANCRNGRNKAYNSRTICTKIAEKMCGVKHKTLMSRSTRLFGSTAPKLLCGSSKNIVYIAVNEAIVMFNEGMTGRIKIMKALGFKIGHFTVTSALRPIMHA